MHINQYINDEQDPKMVEKILGKLQDMLGSGELITYIAVQKKPAVTLFPDCIVLSNKRIFLCETVKLGLSTNFEIFDWSEIKTITFKEEFFGSRFTVVPFDGENLTINHIPKVQARKLYQFSKEAMENQQEDRHRFREQFPLEEHHVQGSEPYVLPLRPEEEPLLKEDDDELTLKLKKLKSLYEKQLISQEEYDNKKNDLLNQL